MTLDRLVLSALSRLETEQSKLRLDLRPKPTGRPTPPDRLPPGRHRVLVRTAPVTILLCDPLGRILETNAEGVAYTRWSRQALLRTTLHALINADLHPAPAIRADGARVWRGMLGRGDGSEARVEVLEGRPLGGEGGSRPVFLRDEEVRAALDLELAGLAAELDAIRAALLDQVRRAAEGDGSAVLLSGIQAAAMNLQALADGLGVQRTSADRRKPETK